MIENYPIKTDSVGRLVIPKEIRNKCNINSTSRLSVIEKEDYILLEKVNYIITIDNYGRVLIPKVLREKYNILNDQVLYLSTTTSGIKIKSKESKYQRIITKLNFLESNYNLKLILINDNNDCIFLNKEYKEIKKFNTIDIEKYLFKNRYNYIKKKFYYQSNETLIIYIIYEKENKQLLDLVYTLL